MSFLPIFDVVFAFRFREDVSFFKMCYLEGEKCKYLSDL